MVVRSLFPQIKEFSSEDGTAPKDQSGMPPPGGPLAPILVLPTKPAAKPLEKPEDEQYTVRRCNTSWRLLLIGACHACLHGVCLRYMHACICNGEYQTCVCMACSMHLPFMSWTARMRSMDGNGTAQASPAPTPHLGLRQALAKQRDAVA